MRFRKTIIMSMLAAVCAVSTAAAASPRLEAPRSLEQASGSRSFTKVATPAGGTFAGLGIGNPNSYSMGDAWVTSDLLPDAYSTDLVWFDDETLFVMGGFYTESTRDVTVTLQVKTTTGATIFADSFTAAPFPFDVNALTEGDLTIGSLPSGPSGVANYKVILKFKQGTKVVGQQFWIPVLSGAQRPQPAATRP